MNLPRRLFPVRDSRGQAMLEYALVTCFVVLVSLVPYVKWTGDGATASLVTGYTDQCKNAIRFLALPCP